MQSYTKLELSAGGFVLLGALLIGYLSIALGKLPFGSTGRYEVTARFSSIAGLKDGDPVRIAGVDIGEVTGVHLRDFAAETTLRLDQDVKVPTDTIASIETEGLLGDAYVSLSPGASDQDIAAGGRIERTEPAVSLTQLIAKYAFGSPTSTAAKSDTSDSPDAAEQPAPPKPSPFEDPLK